MRIERPSTLRYLRSYMSNPQLQRTRYSGRRPLPHAAEQTR